MTDERNPMSPGTGPQVPEVERAEPSAAERRVAGILPYRWRPGQSGNPMGKSGVLARRVRAATDQGRTIYEFLVAVMSNPKESTKYRLQAAHELLDRGWGRAMSAAVIKHLGSDGRAETRMLDAAMLSRRSPEKLQQLEELLRGLAELELSTAPEPESAA